MKASACTPQKEILLINRRNIYRRWVLGYLGNIYVHILITGCGRRVQTFKQRYTGPNKQKILVTFHKEIWKKARFEVITALYVPP